MVVEATLYVATMHYICRLIPKLGATVFRSKILICAALIHQEYDSYQICNTIFACDIQISPKWMHQKFIIVSLHLINCILMYFLMSSLNYHRKYELAEVIFHLE